MLYNLILIRTFALHFRNRFYFCFFYLLDPDLPPPCGSGSSRSPMMRISADPDWVGHIIISIKTTSS